ncbi:hypothetical protein, partial [Mycobacterium avium]|uniref:hypothetical protein n=1 Tax=Mycobacterium avium TaxID=1764 RepID=UPI001F2AC781
MSWTGLPRLRAAARGLSRLGGAGGGVTGAGRGLPRDSLCHTASIAAVMSAGAHAVGSPLLSMAERIAGASIGQCTEHMNSEHKVVHPLARHLPEPDSIADMAFHRGPGRQVEAA